MKKCFFMFKYLFLFLIILGHGLYFDYSNAAPMLGNGRLGVREFLATSGSINRVNSKFYSVSINNYMLGLTNTTTDFDLKSALLNYGRGKCYLDDYTSHFHKAGSSLRTLVTTSKFHLVCPINTISSPLTFDGEGTTTDAFRYAGESVESLTVRANSCQYFNTNSERIPGTNAIRGTGNCGGGSKECLPDGVYTIDPDGDNYAIDSYTKLFINSNTTDGSTSFVDSATSKTITRNGDTINRKLGKVGNGVIAFDGNGDYLSIASSSDLAFGLSDFTIDFWVNFSSLAGNIRMFSMPSSIILYPSWNGVNYTINYAPYGQAGLISGNTSLSINSWFHFAIVRNGSNTTLYINGQVLGTTSTSTDWQASLLNLGTDTGGNFLNGLLQNVRITKGRALRTSAFTPPSQESDYTPAQDTVLFIKGDSISDSSGKGKTITAYGDAKSIKSSFGATSMYFDGNGDYLSLPSSSDFAFGVDDYTIDMYVFHQNINGQQTYFSDVYGNSPGIYLFKTSSNNLGIYYNSLIAQGGTILANKWYHIAVVRSSGTTRLFIDGIQVGSASDTNNLTSLVYSIGDSTGGTSGGFTGFIQNIRISKGIARRTSNFTPPSPPMNVYCDQSTDGGGWTRFLKYSDSAGLILSSGDFNGNGYYYPVISSVTPTNLLLNGCLNGQKKFNLDVSSNNALLSFVRGNLQGGKSTSTIYTCKDSDGTDVYFGHNYGGTFEVDFLTFSYHNHSTASEIWTYGQWGAIDAGDSSRGNRGTVNGIDNYWNNTSNYYNNILCAYYR